MAPSVIEIRNVWKAYGNIQALRDLNICVPAQSVYGFLGPNGAGKTTTIRLILGLQRADRGTMDLLGCSAATQHHDLLKRVGALVESPCAYEHLTGRENLEVHRVLLNLPKSAVDGALETVDLMNMSDRPVRGYSQGMRQRLGLAFALLGQPELLVLDEPTNSLDPAGIRDVRALIVDLPNKHGTTVFLSSHLLAEVEHMATHLAILVGGRVKFEGTLVELQSLSRPDVVVEVDQAERALSILTAAGVQVTNSARRLTVTGGRHTDPGWINTTLVTAGIEVTHLSTRGASLEATFFQMTAEDDLQVAPVRQGP